MFSFMVYKTGKKGHRMENGKKKKKKVRFALPQSSKSSIFHQHPFIGVQMLI